MIDERRIATDRQYRERVLRSFSTVGKLMDHLEGFDRDAIVDADRMVEFDRGVIAVYWQLEGQWTTTAIILGNERLE